MPPHPNVPTSLPTHLSECLPSNYLGTSKVGWYLPGWQVICKHLNSTLAGVSREDELFGHQFNYVSQRLRFTLNRAALDKLSCCDEVNRQLLEAPTATRNRHWHLRQCLKRDGAKLSPSFTQILALEGQKDWSWMQRLGFRTVATRSSYSQATATPDTALTRPEMVSGQIRDTWLLPDYLKNNETKLCAPKIIGTLDVRVRGNTIVPPSILSRFSILCAILRQAHLILQIYFNSELRELQPDAFFVDQLSAGLPLLQYLQPKSPVLFYCHFPDLLLAQGRKKWWKRLYRIPFDAWEQWSMSFANAIAVNSNFTKGIVSQTWPGLARKKELKVVYPCMDVRQRKGRNASHEGPMWEGKRVILSINRFERKKDIALAVKAFAELPKQSRQGVRLVIAGKLLLPSVCNRPKKY